jgi:biotin operon repressor
MPELRSPYIEGGSFNFQVGPKPGGPTEAISRLLEALDSPRSAVELSETLGITVSAVRRRIFSARKSGNYINLTSDGLYWKETGPRSCSRCGNILSRYNKNKTCFSCQISD